MKRRRTLKHKCKESKRESTKVPTYSLGVFASFVDSSWERKEGATQHNRRGDGHIGIDREKKEEECFRKCVVGCLCGKTEWIAQLSFILLCNLITAERRRRRHSRNRTDHGFQATWKHQDAQTMLTPGDALQTITSIASSWDKYIVWFTSSCPSQLQPTQAYTH